MTLQTLQHLPDSKKEELFERLGIQSLQDLKFLGKGGYANVYWLPDKKRVFKITKDKEDAQASGNIQGKRTTHLVRTYDVFQIDRTYYGIVNEKLTPLSSSKANAWKMLTNLYYDDVDNLFWDLPMISQDGLTPQWVMAFKDAVFSSAYGENAEILEDEFDELLMFSTELVKYRIQWRDWYHENIMNRGRTPVISDLGGGTISPRVNIPDV